MKKLRFSLLCLFAVQASTVLFAGDRGWSLRPGEDGVMAVAPSGRDVFGYLKTKPAGSPLSANSACCLFPLLTPAGESVVAMAPPDHKHHRGVFFAWYHMVAKEKADFWGWGAHAPTENRRVVNTSIELSESTPESMTMEVRNEWRVGDQVMVREALTIVSRVLPEGNWHELKFVLSPEERTTVPQAAFSGFCVKAVVGQAGVLSSPGGPVVLPAPKHDDPKTGWPDAPWYDFTALTAGGATAGVSVFSHPSNPATRWHNQANIAMLNPCHLMDGELVLKPDHPLTLRYALLVHDGPVPVAALNDLAKAYRDTR